MSHKLEKTLALLLLFFAANNIYSQTISIDENFGSENGKVIIPNVGVDFLTFDEQGNIFALGASHHIYPAIFKTDKNGIIDEQFRTNSAAVLQEYASFGGSSRRHGIKLTNDNKILIVFFVAGDCSERSCSSGKHVILRFNEDGSLDKSFGSDGEILLDEQNVRIVNTDSKDFMLIVFSENYNNGYENISRYYISKYNDDGEIDLIFGEDGKAYLIGNPTGNKFQRFLPNSIKILKDNSIIAIGYDTWNSTPYAAACKLNEQGKTIADFGNQGVFLSMDNDPFEPKDADKRSRYFNYVAEKSNGDLLISGNTPYYENEAGKMVFKYFLRSFTSSGEYNKTFGENGFLYYDNNLKIYGNNIAKENQFLAVKGNEIISFNNDGTIDETFGNNGSFVFDKFTVSNIEKQNSNQIIAIGEFETESDGLKKTERGFLRLNVDNTTSVKPKNISKNSNSLLISLNLVKNNLRIESGELQIKNIEIVNLSGKTIYQFNDARNQINVSALPQGIYFVKIETDKGIVSKKIIKK
ncbi:MAG: T9SS type A sorting domain-containing protein [Fibromonadales bacterium]|nr:T9SS type A sorting domain-containing protein [Fibromonadales bacterium]